MEYPIMETEVIDAIHLMYEDNPDVEADWVEIPPIHLLFPLPARLKPSYEFAFFEV